MHYSADLRRRFVEEAQVLARLQHPKLVSILETGTVGPVCYLVTPYRAGPSLAQWMEHQEKPIPIELATRLARDLAATVDYVHSRGILHRDNKPSNVLLEPLDGASGGELFRFTPKLTDFGLAKLTEDRVEQTATGAVLGTPAYMAPEQAEGRLADVGVATDVYALGVTLYELLTGRPPYRGGSELQTLRLITEGRLLPPRRLRANTPPDLDAICLKCLELEPSRRYHSARDLADDRTALIEQRPIQARPCGPLKRLAKWGRRRPLVAALAASVVVSLALGLGAASWQWLRAERHRATAEESFLMAHGAVNQFHELLFQKDAFDAPELLSLRNEVLQTALPYYDRLLAHRTTSPTIRGDIADVYYQLGHVALSNDLHEKALGFYRKAADLRAELARQEPARSEHREFLAKICQRIGSILHDDRRSEEALEWLEQVMTIQRQFVNQEPQRMGPKTALAETLHVLVRVQLAKENSKAASELASQAIELCRQVPPQSDIRQSAVERYMADAYVTSACARRAAGDMQGAMEDCEHAVEQQRLVARELEMPTAATQLAGSLELLAHLYAELGDDEEALEQYGQAIAVWKEIVGRHPESPSYQRKFAEALHIAAVCHRSLSRDDDALRLLQQAGELLESLVEQHPQTSSYSRKLARVHAHLGRLHRKRGRVDEGIVFQERAIELTDRKTDDR
jgi:tetratricopeptide (TPR) repeat protein